MLSKSSGRKLSRSGNVSEGDYFIRLRAKNGTYQYARGRVELSKHVLCLFSLVTYTVYTRYFSSSC